MQKRFATRGGAIRALKTRCVKNSRKINAMFENYIRDRGRGSKTGNGLGLAVGGGVVGLTKELERQDAAPHRLLECFYGPRPSEHIAGIDRGDQRENQVAIKSMFFRYGMPSQMHGHEIKI